MKPNGIVFHWTAGRYNQTFDDYHYNVTYEPKTKKAKKVITCESDEEMKYHSWPSKSCAGTIGISACSMLNATEENWGECPITDTQIEMMAAIAGEKVKEYGIPYDEIYTHATWANYFDYGPGSGDPETRWDLWIPNWKNTGKNLSQYIVDKTIWYAENAGKKPDIIPLPPKPVVDKHYTELVHKYATQYNLRVEFVHSIIKQESDYNPLAISKSGAVGLMQLLPSTAKDIAAKLCIENINLQDPEQNIRMGCYYLSWCKNNLDLEWCIACGYNQGIGHFKRGTMPVDGLNYANEVKKRIYSK